MHLRGHGVDQLRMMKREKRRLVVIRLGDHEDASIYVHTHHELHPNYASAFTVALVMLALIVISCDIAMLWLARTG